MLLAGAKVTIEDWFFVDEKYYVATIRCDNSKGQKKRVEDDVLKRFFSSPLFFGSYAGFL